MKGDFTRGIQPDAKRGRRYRRVLLQQGRVLLDSDQVASVDALQREDRDILRHVACASGSSNAGFLCTPGRLLALFESAADVEPVSGDPRAVMDYRHRFVGRQPALSLSAEGGSAASVSVHLRAESRRLAVWARAENATTLTISGVTHALAPDSPPTEFQRLVYSLASPQRQVTLTVPSGATVWVALIESDIDAEESPGFYSAAGSYQIDGLSVEVRADTAFPESGFPSAAGFWSAGSPPEPPLPGLLAAPIADGDLVIAYLEAWERHVTAIEDPGIRERALGGTDTTTRTEALGQVKVALAVGISGSVDEIAERVRAAFGSVQASGGTLAISQQPASETNDPCALPEQQGGYRGADNRLYRFEVHRGGPLSSVRFKWSRNNGAELFEAVLDSTHQLLVPKSVPLAGNDLVEVLSEVIDLGDEVGARVEPAGFVPAERAVGTLARLVEVDTVASNHRVFTLVDPADSSLPIVMATEVLPRLGDLTRAHLRLRRWDGVLDPNELAGPNPISAGPHEVEDGIALTLSATGSYDPGQFWQYEARVGSPNANGQLPATPHGPERLFAPLALFEYRGPAEPLALLAWLDQRYPRLCEVSADDVRYDGARVESPSHTVQEALDELFSREPEIIDSGCGSLLVRPENTLQAVFDAIPVGADAKICIHPGSWPLTAAVLVENKGHLVIEGAGEATRISSADLDSLLVFRRCSSVTIQGLSLRGGAVTQDGSGLEGVLSFDECGSVDVRGVTVVCGAAPTRRASAIRVLAEPSTTANRKVRVGECDIEVGHGQTGILVVNADAVDVHGNELRTPESPLDWSVLINDPSVAAWLGRLLLDNVVIGETAEANDELLVGSPDVVVNASPGEDGRPRIIVHLEQWGYEFITFSTHPALGTAFWEPLFVANPIHAGGVDEVDPHWIHANLRRFRANLARFMYSGAASANVTVPAGAPRTTLLNLTTSLVSRGAVTAGGQGIVVGGRRAPSIVPAPDRVRPPRAPDVRITDNRVLGFTQGIHVGSSHSGDANRHLRIYRVHVHRNTVALHIPPIARERHGIFVGNAHNVQVVDNLVELVVPEPIDTQGPVTDGIRVWGNNGPMLQVHGNHTVGVHIGVRVHVLNATSTVFDGIGDNRHSGVGVPQVLTP